MKRLPLLLLFGWFIFCWFFILWGKLPINGTLYDLYLDFNSWDAPFWLFLSCILGALFIIAVRKLFGLLNENSSSLTRDSLILISLIPLAALLVTAFAISTEKLFFGKSHVLYDWIKEFGALFVVEGIVILSLVWYFYLSVVDKLKERLANAQQTQSEMQLKLLQQKVDPHFLFNNLSVLSSLIEKDPATANVFLDKLADLYRYVLQNQSAEIIPLKDELLFSRNYLYLIEKRFGNAYRFDWNVPENKIEGKMIVPASLQSLIENAVKHNAGDQDSPLEIRVELKDNDLIVENRILEKQQTRPTTGTGLKNLKERFAFFTDRPVKILQENGLFRVSLPLIDLK